MHRRRVNEAVLSLALRPEGPLLVRAANPGADPTRPDVEFARTRRAGLDTVYLPGSSLKGALRAHCERIARTVGGEGPDRRPRLSCNPLGSAPDGPGYSCNRRLHALAERADARRAYRDSCFVCQLFGNQHEAAHLRIADTYPATAPRVEPRASVGVDRVYGSAAVGPLTYEVVTDGRFETEIALHNFTLAQFGLLALALRDLREGRLALGSGKSHGLGRVGVEITALTVHYPGSDVHDGALATTSGAPVGPADQLYGAGAFPETGGYGFPTPDAVSLPAGVAAADDGWGGAEARVDGAALDGLWRGCVGRWAARVQAAVGAA
ncbi:MAG TPA: RAMP superfamily CRISPR-associated protein [Chloroflexota bacterium]|jgi:CRISPR/Cas system CSM-associated protein Csm3 (group 7 of RAMP superfamily)